MNTPDLSIYRAVHRGLRAGAAGLAAAAERLDAADRDRRRAWARYCTGYIGEILTHHTVEDEFFFPALVARVPVAADLIDRTDADHAHLDELLAELAGVARDVAAGQAPSRAVTLTAELADHMQTHLDFEDQDVLPLFERHFGAEEYQALDQQALASLKVGRQTAFSVPFVCAACSPEELASTLADAPLPMRVLYRATRRSHERLTRQALGASLPELVR